MAEACGGWSSILTSKMHESGQCGSPACLQQREREGERERGSCTWQWAHAKLNLCRTHLRPMRNSIRHASGAAGSATATVTGNDKKRERKRNTKIKKKQWKMYFHLFRWRHPVWPLVSPSSRQSGPSIYSSWPFQFQGQHSLPLSLSATLQYLLKSIVSHKDPKHNLCCNAEQSKRL